LTFGLLLIFSFLIIQCGLDIEDPTPPSPPQWVEKSLPEEWPERGIDAHESGGIYLEWEPSPNGDIIGYTIYRSSRNNVDNSLGDYILLVHVDVEKDADLEYIDRETELDIQYYYKLKAIDEASNKSAFSDSIFYTKTHSIPLETMRPNGIDRVLPGNRELRWTAPITMELEDYYLTLVTIDGELILRENLLPGGYAGGEESWNIPPSINLLDHNNYEWRIDTGARYYGGRETSGSESRWVTFLYLVP
jgi:hypothetical protein